MPEPTPGHEPINSRAIGTYLQTLGSSAPTPGGGSASGVIGALGASLGLMVISLTRPGDDVIAQQLDTVRTTLEGLRDRFTELAEADERVFDGYQAAAALPKSTEADQQARKAALQEALKGAANVPRQACETAVELAQILTSVQEIGNPHLLSDAQIAILCATTCFEASRINVNVNLAMIRDDAWVTETANRVEALASDLQSQTTGPIA